MRTAAVLLCCLVLPIRTSFAQGTPCAPRKSAVVPALFRLSYHEARRLLIANGWQPIQARTSGAASAGPTTGYGNYRVFVDIGYTEVDDCAPTGLANCAFSFADVYGNHLGVYTAGEESPESGASAKVTGFRFLCDRRGAGAAATAPGEPKTSYRVTVTNGFPFPIIAECNGRRTRRLAPGYKGRQTLVFRNVAQSKFDVTCWAMNEAGKKLHSIGNFATPAKPEVDIRFYYGY